MQYDDLEQFIDMYAPFAKGATISEAYVNGGSNPQGNYSASEGNMDIQYAVGTAYDVPIEFISVGGGLWDYTPDLEYVALPSMPSVPNGLLTWVT